MSKGTLVSALNGIKLSYLYDNVLFSCATAAEDNVVATLNPESLVVNKLC